MLSLKHNTWWVVAMKLSFKPPKRPVIDVVICSSDSGPWDYTPFVNSVIPANLGFSFTLHSGHEPPIGEDWEYGATKCLSGYMVCLMKDVFAGPGLHLAVPSVDGPILSSSVRLHVWGQWSSSAQVEWCWFHSHLCVFVFVQDIFCCSALYFNLLNIACECFHARMIFALDFDINLPS